MTSSIDDFIGQIRSETDIFNKARLLSYLNKQKSLRIKDLAARLNMKPSYVCHIIRLLRVPEIIIDGYYSQLITISHLFIISRIKDNQKMTEAYEKILTDSLTVFQTEEMVRDILHNVKTSGSCLDDKARKDLTGKIEKNFAGVRARIIQTRIKAKLVLEISGDPKQTTKVLTNLTEVIGRPRGSRDE